MSSFKLRVKIEEIGEVQTLGEGNFTKRDLIGVIDGEYPEHYKFEFIKDKAALLDDLIPNTYVDVFFNIRGRKVDNKKKKGESMYFTSLQAWKVEL